MHHCASRFSCLSVVLAGLALCPLASAAQQPYFHQKEVLIPMRDQTGLATNLFLPQQGGPFPVILMRTPYGKSGQSDQAKRYCPAGYAVVVQDCRGCGRSRGVWDPFRYDGDDGFDTQEWVGHQSWCNGHIGTAGKSYVGWTQWAAATRRSQYLTCMAPMVAFADAFQEVIYPGGAFQLALAFGWGTEVGGLKLGAAKLNEEYGFLPLNRWDEQNHKRVPYLRDWVDHPTYDDYWRVRSIDSQYDRITVPVLNISGWYDIFAKATLDHCNQVRDSSTNPLARHNQYAIIGPWGHGIGTRQLGELDFGPAAKLDLDGLQFAWMERWLQGKGNAIKDWPAIRFFTMGENLWHGEPEWPLARTEYTPWYFHGNGKAASRNGDGTLSATAPATEAPDRFEYDPATPVPTHGGNNLIGTPTGPFDQGSLEDYSDVLVFTSAPLATPVEVTGPVKVILYAATSARDTDFTAKLVDVYANGKAYNLCDGIIRTRYRESLTDPTLITPGATYRYEIDLWVTSNLFKAGHRILVEISSSNFPRFDRNPNTGHAFGTDTELATAAQTIFHDTAHPSHVLLPIIPR